MGSRRVSPPLLHNRATALGLTGVVGLSHDKEKKADTVHETRVGRNRVLLLQTNERNHTFICHGADGGRAVRKAPENQAENAFPFNRKYLTTNHQRHNLHKLPIL